MSTTKINIPAEEVSTGGSVVRCQNLTGSNRDGRKCLVMADEAAPVASEPLLPLAEYHNGTSKAILMHTSPDSTGQYTIKVLHDGIMSTLGTLPSAPLCAVTVRDGFIIMTGSGPTNIDYSASGSWEIRRKHAFPAFAIKAQKCGMLWETTEELTTSDVDLSRTSPSISARDNKSLTASLLNAYTRLSAKASDAGLWIQPILVRYHVLDRNGNRIYSSAPVAISADGWQCCDSISTATTKNGTTLEVPGITLQAEAYKLSITPPDAGDMAMWTPEAAAIEICATPQLHPADYSEQAPCRIARPSTAQPELTTALPGATTFMRSRQQLRMDRMKSAIARLDALEKPIALLTAPFPESGTTAGNPSGNDAPEETAIVNKALSRTTDNATHSGSKHIIQSIKPPHTFTAAAATTSGDTVAWADITPHPAAGHPLHELAAESEPTAWHATTAINFRSGRTIVNTTSGCGKAPTALNPLISYPHPDATAMEIYLETATGNVSRASVKLTASDDGSQAIFINPGLETLTLEPWDGDIPTESDNNSHGPTTRFAGTVVSARLDAPLMPIADLICTNAPIVALHPAVRSQSSWDFSRCHLYAFTPAGIHAVSVNGNRHPVSATIIDPRGTTSQRATTFTPNGIMAISGSELICVAGARASTVATGINAIETGWHAPSETLWLMDSRGNLTVRHTSTGMSHEVLTPVNIEHLTTISSTIFLTSTDSLLQPAKPSSKLRPICWTASHSIKARQRVAAIEIGMAATEFKGTVKLRCHGGAGTAESMPLLTLTVDGAINAPIITRLQSPPRRYLAVEINGEASTDFTLDYITLYTDR